MTRLVTLDWWRQNINEFDLSSCPERTWAQQRIEPLQGTVPYELAAEETDSDTELEVAA